MAKKPEINVQLLKASIEAAQPVWAEMITHALKMLFMDFPGAQSLFASQDLAVQEKSVADALARFIDRIDDSGATEELARQFGSTHASHGAQAEHYQWIGASLIKTLKYYFGPQWSSELEDVWSKTYQWIAQSMQERKSAPAESPVAQAPMAQALTVVPDEPFAAPVSASNVTPISAGSAPFSANEARGNAVEVHNLANKMARDLLLRAIEAQLKDPAVLKIAQDKAVGILRDAIVAAAESAVDYGKKIA